MARGKKKNYFFLCILATFVVFLICRMVLLRLVGSTGVAYFSASNEIFFAFAFAIAFGIEQSVSILVESRMAKQMYSNVNRIINGGLFLAVALGVIVSFVLFLLSHKYTDSLLMMPRAYLAVIVLLPSIPFLLMTGVFRGYFDGVSYRHISIQSHFVFCGLYAILGIVFADIFLKYGDKVATILRVEDFKYAYGALGASLGILLASFISLIHMLVLFVLFRRRTNFSEEKYYQRGEETFAGSMLNVFFTGISPFVCIGSFLFNNLVNELVIFKSNDIDGNVTEFSFGEYYGKTFPMFGILTCFLGMFAFSYLRRSLSALYRDENKSARDRLGRMIHRCSTFGFFVSAMIMVLAENILGLFFETNGADTVKYLVIESIAIVFGLFAITMSQILSELGYVNLVAIICGIAFVLDAILTYILGFVANMSIFGVIISNIVFYLLVAVFSFIMVSKCFQYTQEWFRSFLVSIIGSIICALIGMLINKALLMVAGKFVSLIISLIISMILYVIILLALKGYSEDELEASALGKFVLYLGRTFRLI